MEAVLPSVSGQAPPWVGGKLFATGSIQRWVRAGRRKSTHRKLTPVNSMRKDSPGEQLPPIKSMPHW